MNAEHKTTGICRFSSPLSRSGSARGRDGRTTEWWLILECDREIGRYPRALHWTANHRLRQLSEPLWGTHVSVIRDEVPIHAEHWKSMERASLEVTYRPRIEFRGSYAFLPADCEPALDYRESLGLPRHPEFPLHMTIGNFKPIAA